MVFCEPVLLKVDILDHHQIVRPETHFGFESEVGFEFGG